MLSAIDRKDTTKENAATITRMIKEDSKKIDSQALRALIQNKLGLIEPSSFRKDLLNFLLLMEIFTNELLNVIDVDFWEDISSARLRIRKCQKVTHHYRVVIDHFSSFLDREVFGKETALSESNYEPLLNKGRFNKIRSFLVDEPLDPSFDKQFEDYRREAIKDLGIE